MAETLLSELKRLVGFVEGDAVLLRLLGEDIAAFLPRVEQRFRLLIRDNPQSLAIFIGREDKAEGQLDRLTSWIEDLFSGSFAQQHYRTRLQSGRNHAKADLAQYCLPTATELIRRELEGVIRQENVADTDRKLASLHKLLTLDLAIMLEGYQEVRSQNIRETERRIVAEKLTRAEHLAEVGQMAASLAHEIKNPLAGISGAIQIIGDAMPGGDPHRPIIGEILGQIKRLDAAVKDLLVYARPTAPRNKEYDLNSVIRRVLMILHEEPAVQRVRIKYNRRAEIPPGLGDESQLEQLLMNLIINAAEASAAKGLVLVSTTFDNEDLVFSVTDSGCGMTPAVQARAFEPFFTDKAKGTGLGLSICRRIIDAHNGKISLDSIAGEGTTVVVSLPRLRP